jgi:hypothetical protein
VLVMAPPLSDSRQRSPSKGEIHHT